jgi:hypothetical protein
LGKRGQGGGAGAGQGSQRARRVQRGGAGQVPGEFRVGLRPISRWIARRKEGWSSGSLGEMRARSDTVVALIAAQTGGGLLSRLGLAGIVAVSSGRWGSVR